MARYNICVPRPKKGGGTYWHKIGAAFDSEKGGFDLVFDSLPGPTLDVNERDGTMRLSTRAKAFPADEDRDGGNRGSGSGGWGGQDRGPPPADDLDDELPPF